MNNFNLDSRLAADSFPIGQFELCEVRLINDTRWPWLILVPRIEALEEIHDASPSQQTQMANETNLAAKTLKQLTNCEKINSAAIGNIVRQLHIHVIARNESDANWPGPVWGYGSPQRYDAAVKAQKIEQFHQALSTSALFKF